MGNRINQIVRVVNDFVADHVARPAAFLSLVALAYRGAMTYPTETLSQEAKVVLSAGLVFILVTTILRRKV